MSNSAIDRLLSPVSRFIRQEYAGALVLLAAVVVAIVWANSSWAPSYHELWDMKLSIRFHNYELRQPLHSVINDGLMALFFFVIGLELKREFMAGELSDIRKASLPMAAALGGMLVPAIIYFGINHGNAASAGWGIPMATDIAFALGILSLAGKRIPTSVKVFLSALAVADDLGAVLVIAFFYTAHIAILPLIIGFLFLLVLFIGNLLGIRNTTFYLIAGLCVWLGFLSSGVHATIAGVLVAIMIPARTKVDEQEYTSKLKKYTAEFEQAIPQAGALTTSQQHHTIEHIAQLSLDATTPLQKIEHALHPWVAFLVMPLFALANAGIDVSSNFFSSFSNPVSVGIILGLVVGKFLGILSFSWLMIRLKWSTLPDRSGWQHIIGVALLAGVGFTMSLFIAELAFDDAATIVQAKSGIIVASLVAGIAGFLLLKRAKA